MSTRFSALRLRHLIQMYRGDRCDGYSRRASLRRVLVLALQEAKFRIRGVTP